MRILLAAEGPSDEVVARCLIERYLDMDRRSLKRALFGNPPRHTAKKTEALAHSLIDQMEENDDWPITLRWFVDDLTAPSS